MCAASSQDEGSERLRADQCQYGLTIVKGNSEHLLTKKPTDFMVNPDALARRLSRRCTGEHVHHPLQ